MKFPGWLVFLCAFGIFPSVPSPAQAPATNAPASSLSQTQLDTIQIQMRTALQAIGSNNLDAALESVNTVLKLQPENSTAYNLRGAIYSRKKQYDAATQDFTVAKQYDPKNAKIDFNLTEIKFMQKQYDAARPGFIALKSDPDLSDLAAYKVFLCDLFAGHADESAAELAAFNNVGSNPSYYFSNAAADLYNKKIESARGWLTSAANIYSAQKFQYYAATLTDLGYLPLPAKPATN